MMRWRCRPYQPLLVEAVEGTLDDAQRQRLDRHLARCPRCSADVAALRDVPALLQTSIVPDPGEAFWVRQRQAIGRAVRQAPAPQAGWGLDWLQEAMRRPVWRYPIAVGASVIVALLVYRFAERPPATPSGAAAVQIAQLDSDSLAALRDLMRALEPADEPFSQVSSDDETQLAALPLNELVGVSVAPELPRTSDLNESELEGIGDLIGDLG